MIDGSKCVVAPFSIQSKNAWRRSCENSKLPCSLVSPHLAWREAFLLASSKKGMAGAMNIATGGDWRHDEVIGGTMMSTARFAMILAASVIAVTSLAGCVVHERHDGGVTIRPLH